MEYTLSDFVQSLYGLVAFSLFGFAPGYLLTAFPLFKPSPCSRLERVLWSLVLSLPVSILLCLNIDRFVSTRATPWLFGLLGASAALLLVRDSSRAYASRSFRWSRQVTIVCLALICLMGYGLLAPLGIQVHHRLYESAAAQDWGVRSQLVHAAMRSSVTPHNPLFAVAGKAPTLHYYFFWYVLCAHVCRLTSIAARPALAASCIWASFSLVASIFLSLRYLGPKCANLRRQCVVALLVACVLGLDIIPAIIGLCLPRTRLYPDVEFWLEDRSPGWLGAILWMPHHVAGLTFCMAATLILFLMQRHDPWSRLVAQAVLAAALFAATVGTSTYIAGLFLVVGLAVMGERLFRHQWKVASAFALVGLVTVLLAGRFISQNLASQAASDLASGTRNHVVLFMLRGNHQAVHLYLYFTHPLAEIRRATAGKATLFAHVVRLPTIFLFYLLEFGFYAFVLAGRIREDFGRTLSKSELWLWLIFLAFALPAFSISSLPIQGNNDFGRHAGMCMRFILLLWATPMVAKYLEHRREPAATRTPYPSNVLRAAKAAFVLGIAGQVWQIGVTRLYLPLVDLYGLASYNPAHRFPHIAHRFFEMRQAMQAAKTHSGEDDIVQGNPQGRLQDLLLLYATRQMAAYDTGCAIPFGGDPAQCAPVARSLVALFGGSGPHHQGDGADKFRLSPDPAMVTGEAFRAACAQHSIKLLVVSYVDPVWRMPLSWAHTEQPIFANSTARVYQCPAAPGQSEPTPR